MSTHLNDLASQVLLQSALAPISKTASVNGAGVDMLSADGNCFATQHVGVVSGTNPTWDGKIQESADNSTNWTDITGATFTQVTASANLQVITFQRTKRYLRYVGTIGGTSTPTFLVGAVIGEPYKQV